METAFWLFIAGVVIGFVYGCWLAIGLFFGDDTNSSQLAAAKSHLDAAKAKLAEVTQELESAKVAALNDRMECAAATEENTELLRDLTTILWIANKHVGAKADPT